MSAPEASDDDEQDVIVQVLNGRDHYAVLGVPETVESAALRRAYLTRSVKVHPDKCNDPRATEAFQRVAEAFTVLSDEETRSQYDERGKHQADSDPHVYTPPPPPSFQDALFAFAAVTSMMGGSHASSTAGSMAQTMYWAEKLSRDRGTSNTSSKAERTSNAAMAVGASLRAVAVGARMMGFKQASVVADRTASLAQSVGVGAMVADAAKDNPAVKQVLDNPAVKEAFEKGGERAKQISGSISRSVTGNSRYKR